MAPCLAVAVRTGLPSSRQLRLTDYRFPDPNASRLACRAMAVRPRSSTFRAASLHRLTARRAQVSVVRLPRAHILPGGCIIDAVFFVQTALIITRRLVASQQMLKCRIFPSPLPVFLFLHETRSSSEPVPPSPRAVTRALLFSSFRVPARRMANAAVDGG
jgi:hypothetical protein